MLAMHCDPKTALYYLELEDLIFRFFDGRQSEELKKQVALIDSLKTHCFVYKVAVYNESGEEIEYYYIGTTKNKLKRLQKHYYESSNPKLRKLSEEGRKIKYFIIY